MLERLNIEDSDEQMVRLQKAFLQDPILVCKRIQNELRADSIAAALQDELEEILCDIKYVLRRISDTVTAFEINIPARTSVFRGGADSVALYRQLCPFLMSLTDRRRELQTKITQLANMREQLKKAYCALSAVEWKCTVCVEMNEERAACQKEMRLQRRLLQDADQITASIHAYDKNALHRAIEEMGRLSDAENAGSGCDCTGVCQLLAMLFNETQGIEKRIKNDEKRRG